MIEVPDVLPITAMCPIVAPEPGPVTGFVSAFCFTFSCVWMLLDGSTYPIVVGVTPSMVMPVRVVGISALTIVRSPTGPLDPLGVARNSFCVNPVVAATESVGVVVEVATLGVNHAGHVPAIKFVTEPPPVPRPVKVQAVPVHEPAPAEKLKVNGPVVLLIEETPADRPQFPPDDVRHVS